MNVFRQAQEARQIAQQQMIADNRRDLARRAPLPSTVDPDASLRAAQARATANADAPVGGTGTAIGRMLPAAARAAAGLAVSNPKLWEADVKPLKNRKLDSHAWLAQVRVAAWARESGDVLTPTIVRTAELVVWAVRSAGTGFARKSFESLAGLVGCCKETVRKVIRFLEKHGLLDTFNILQRTYGFVRRAANLYLIPEVSPDPKRPAGNSRAERLTRYAELFVFRVRPWGLNATPAPVGYRKPRAHPLPS
jgi:hypothetical protein